LGFSFILEISGLPINRQKDQTESTGASQSLKSLRSLEIKADVFE
tara:strand:+ start:1804 stop:1938 length:135 start_codon:yes stop_codon:yes gene_type:complete